MPLILKYQGKQRERNDKGYVTTLIWTGTQSECEAFAAELSPGDPGENGTLDSVRIYQDGGNIWNVERRYSQDQDGNFTNKPNMVYGKKSAQLHGAMLSLPLEHHRNYHTNWNYYLAVSPKASNSDLPDWWDTARNTSLSLADSQKYRWVKSPSECPQDSNGQWRILKDAQYPGVNSYDIATYTITETAKFNSAKKAGTMVAKQLNKIGKPDEDFGLSAGGYNWKCDNAEVSYNGGDWFAHLTWTRSGDNKGWNTEIYGGLNL